MNIVFIVSGGGGILRKTANAIARGACEGWRMTKVIADRECGALAYARNNGIVTSLIPFHDLPRAVFDERLCAEVASASPDLVVLTYNRLLSSTVVNALYDRLINVHFSLLPAFPGFKAVEKAYAAGVRYSGSTIHRVDKNMDTGRIVAQALVAMDPALSFEELQHRIFLSACWNLLNVMDHFGNGRIRFEGKENMILRDLSFLPGPFLPNLSEKIEAYRNEYENVNDE